MEQATPAGPRRVFPCANAAVHAMRRCSSGRATSCSRRSSRRTSGSGSPPAPTSSMCAVTTTPHLRLLQTGCCLVPLHPLATCAPMPSQLAPAADAVRNRVHSLFAASATAGAVKLPQWPLPHCHYLTSTEVLTRCVPDLGACEQRDDHGRDASGELLQ